MVADEVKKLADETRVSTRLIEERVAAIHDSVANVSAIVVAEKNGSSANEVVTMSVVDRQVRSMAETAGNQRGGASELHELGDQSRALSEELLLAVGTLRFSIHERAARDLAMHASLMAEVLHDRTALEGKLHNWLRSDPCFELLYVTDARGRQIVSNIGRREGSTWADPAGFGREWARRLWFTEAIRLGGEVHVSDIYRSTATGDFCFTVSIALSGRNRELTGVLAADVNFQTLVAMDPAQKRAKGHNRLELPSAKSGASCRPS